MPRDGSGIYTRPPGTNAVADTTIESTKYNANVADVEADLNAPRPIIAGGTGANNAVDAANNLGVVTGKGAQTFTEAEKAVARNNIAAAPFDALAYNGMQVNGSMEVSQEKGLASTGSNSYIMDVWQLYKGGSMVVAASQGTGVSNSFPYHLSVATTTAQPSLASGDGVLVQHSIEGWRTIRCAWSNADARPVTIAFWSLHSRTGVYSVTIRNVAFNRCYATTYTHNVSNGAQYNTITIPGDTTGTWDKSNGIGMNILFAIATGATNVAPSANAWLAGNYQAAPGQVNGVDSTANVFRIYGVVVLPGTQAPTAAQSPLIMRPYDQELVMCQRYYQEVGGAFAGRADSASSAQGIVGLSTPMRAPPTVSLTSTVKGTNGLLVPGVGVLNVTAVVGSHMTTDHVLINLTTTPVTAGNTVVGYGNYWCKADARL